MHIRAHRSFPLQTADPCLTSSAASLLPNALNTLLQFPQSPWVPHPGLAEVSPTPLLDKNGVSRQSLYSTSLPSPGTDVNVQCVQCAQGPGKLSRALHLRRKHTPPSGLAGCQRPPLSFLLRKVFQNFEAIVGVGALLCGEHRRNRMLNSGCQAGPRALSSVP